MRVPLQLRSRWITAGAWAPNESLLLVDAGSGQLLRFSKSGLKSIHMRESLLVSDIKPTEKGFVLRLRDGRFVTLDRSGNLTGTIGDLTSHGLDWGVKGIFNWTLAGDAIVGFGDMMGSNGWQSGWFNLRLHDNPKSFNLLESVPLTDPSRRLYQLGNPYSASIGTEAYFLSLARRQLFVVSKTKNSFAWYEIPLPMSAASYSLPKLPYSGSVNEIVSTYRFLESTSIPAGLYSQGSNLYLLVRQPTNLVGQSEWKLIRLDPKSGRTLGEFLLPTRANHVLVIPGQESWAIVEKGPVRSLAQQDVNGILFIPTSLINGRSQSPQFSPDRAQPIAKLEVARR
jgi:hypothetical protein